MTKREMYEAIVNGNINEEVREFARNEIEKLNVANAKRREKVSKKAAENAPLVERIVTGILGEEPLTATEVGEALGVSAQKASALCRRAVAEGRANVEEIKVKGKGVRKGYTVC